MRRARISARTAWQGGVCQGRGVSDWCLPSRCCVGRKNRNGMEARGGKMAKVSLAKRRYMFGT